MNVLLEVKQVSLVDTVQEMKVSPDCLERQTATAGLHVKEGPQQF